MASSERSYFGPYTVVFSLVSAGREQVQLLVHLLFRHAGTVVHNSELPGVCRVLIHDYRIPNA